MPPITPSPTDLAEESGNVPPANIENSIVNMSDSESISDPEIPDHYEYSPLSQDPENVLDVENDEEGFHCGIELEDSAASEANNLNQPLQEDKENTSCWKSHSEILPMDEEHIETIKSVMKGIKLPSSSLPPWANAVPEEEWKAVLLAKMQDKQNKDRNDARNNSKVDNSWCDFSSEAQR